MLIRRRGDIRSSEITDEQIYVHRREFMRVAGAAAITGAVGALTGACGDAPSAAGLTAGGGAGGQSPLANIKPGVVKTDEKLNSFEDITSYNNFYEFGTGKNDPAQLAGRMKTSPWTVKLDGLCNKPASYQLEDLIKPIQLEERVYRLRCVEAWSMVIPWVGIPLSEVLKRAEPQGKAAYRRVHDAWPVRRRCPDSGSRHSNGRTSKGCGWTRRCIRSRSSRSVSTARR